MAYPHARTPPLTQSGADPKLADGRGRTALICAVHSRSDDTAYMLRDMMDRLPPEQWREVVNMHDRLGVGPHEKCSCVYNWNFGQALRTFPLRLEVHKGFMCICRTRLSHAKSFVCVRDATLLFPKAPARASQRHDHRNMARQNITHA